MVHLMVIVNDRDLRSSLRYFLENSNRQDGCRIFLEEERSKTEESFKACIEFTASQASSTKHQAERFEANSTKKGKLKTINALSEFLSKTTTNVFMIDEVNKFIVRNLINKISTPTLNCAMPQTKIRGQTSDCFLR